MFGVSQNGENTIIAAVTEPHLAGTAECDTFAPDMPKVKVSLRIRELAEPVGITNPYELSKRTGMPYESCRLIWSENTRRIDLTTIEKLCEVFGVIPGHLFTYEYQPDEPEVKPSEPKSKGKRKG
jgi:DNA-binding Xre family transcriptional regulator